MDNLILARQPNLVIINNKKKKWEREPAELYILPVDETLLPR